MLFLLIIGFFLIGLVFLSLFRICDREDLLILSFPVGSGLTTLVIFTLEQIGLITIQRGTCFLVIGVLLAIEVLAVKLADSGGLRVLARKSKLPAPGIDSSRVPLQAKISLFYLLLLVPLALLHGIMLPISNWDSFGFWLMATEYIFKTGHLPMEVGPSVFHFGPAYPLFALMVPAIEAVILGHFTHYLYKALPPLYVMGTFILIYRACRKYLDKDILSSLGALLLCCTVEILIMVATLSSFDTQFIFFCMGAVYFVLRYSKEKERRALWLSGVFIGLAYWTNYKGLTFYFVTATSILLLRLLPRLFKKPPMTNISLGGLACLSVGALLISSPHMLRNWILVNNPIYPALPTVLGGKGMTPWAIEYLLSYHFPRGITDIIPALDIFNHGFCVLIFLILSLAGRDMWRKKENILIASMAIIYWLVWFTTLRLEDIDVTHYLLPAILLGAMLGGEPLARILKGEAPRSILWTVVGLLSAWWWFQFRLESRIMGYVYLHRAYHFFPPLNPLTMNWGTWKSWLSVTEAVIFDFFEIIISMGLLLAYFSRGKNISHYNLAICLRKGKSFRLGLAPVILFVSTGLFLSMPLSQIGIPLIFHVDRAKRYPDYSIVEDIRPRWIVPEGEWMINNLPQDSLLYSFNNRTYIIPRKIFPALSLELRPLYDEGTGIEKALEILKNFGITHIYLNSIYDNYPLWGKSIIFDKLNDQRYFTLLYEGENIWEVRKIWIYKINYDREQTDTIQGKKKGPHNG